MRIKHKLLTAATVSCSLLPHEATSACMLTELWALQMVIMRQKPFAARVCRGQQHWTASCFCTSASLTSVLVSDVQIIKFLPPKPRFRVYLWMFLPAYKPPQHLSAIFKRSSARPGFQIFVRGSDALAVTWSNWWHLLWMLFELRSY